MAKWGSQSPPKQVYPYDKQVWYNFRNILFSYLQLWFYRNNPKENGSIPAILI